MELLTLPNSKIVLTTKCETVTDFPSVQSELEEMGKVAFQNGLVGLAANQVGLSKRMFVVVATGTVEKTEYKPFINPVIKPVTSKGKYWDWEGCGSIPNSEFLIERWKEIDLVYQNMQGETFTERFSGFLGRICQHETDHLNGILISSKFRQRRVTK